MNDEVYFWHADKHRTFLQVDAVILGVRSEACPKHPNKKFVYLCNIFRKTWEMKFIFCLQINKKVFCKLIVSIRACVARHAQSTQSNKFAISLQYLKENVKDEVDFLSADKHQRFLQIDSVIKVCVASHA